MLLWVERLKCFYLCEIVGGQWHPICQDFIVKLVTKMTNSLLIEAAE